LPEPPPASTLIDWPDMGSSQVLFVRKIDSFLRVPLSATGAGDPSPAGLRVADALAGNAPRSSRAKTGVPRPACFCITWPGLDIPAALMGFIQAVLIPTSGQRHVSMSQLLHPTLPRRRKPVYFCRPIVDIYTTSQHPRFENRRQRGTSGRSSSCRWARRAIGRPWRTMRATSA
jgi:hypothetical protein